MSEPPLAKCDITGKHPSGDPNAKCESISPSTPAQAGPAPQEPPSKKASDILFTLPGCGHCAQAKQTEGVQTGKKTGELREVSYDSAEGKDLAKKHGIESAPKILHEGPNGMEICQVSLKGEALCKSGTITYGSKEEKK